MKFWNQICDFFDDLAKNPRVKVKRDDRIVEVPLQEFLGERIAKLLRAAGFLGIDKVNYIEKMANRVKNITETTERLVDHISQLEEEKSELEGRIEGLERENEAFKENFNRFIRAAEDADNALTDRVDRCYEFVAGLSTGKVESILTSETKVRPEQPAETQRPPATPARHSDSDDLLARLDAQQPAHAPSPQPPPAPRVPPAPPPPPPPAQITDDEVSTMCSKVCGELGRSSNVKMVERCLKYDRSQGREALRAEIKEYFLENMIKNDILRAVGATSNRINDTKAYELARKVISKEITNAHADKEMKIFLAAQPAPTAPAIDPVKMKQAYQEIIAIASEEGFTKNHSLDYNADITAWTKKLATVAASAVGESQEMDDVKMDARTFFKSIVESFKKTE